MESRYEGPKMPWSWISLVFWNIENKMDLYNHHPNLAHRLVFGQRGIEIQVRMRVEVGRCKPPIQWVATSKSNGAHGPQRGRSSEGAAGTRLSNSHGSELEIADRRSEVGPL